MAAGHGAYASQETATVPAASSAALETNPEANKAFETLGKTGRYLLILPLLQATTPQARQVRIAAALQVLENSKTPE